MSTTLNLIAKQTVGSGGAASVSFSNIPQTFTDLQLILSARQGAENAFDLTFNGSTSSYSVIRLQGDGSSASSNTASGHTSAIRVIGVESSGNTANTFSNTQIYIPNYTSSNNKSVSIDGVNEANTSEIYMNLAAGLWSNSATITSITITPRAGSLAEFSTFYLYGISSSSTQNTSVPLASGGDIIKTDGSYWYHTFLYSGSFTPLKALTCDYLVVAGGGGSAYEPSGAYYLGGGGGGGLRTSVGTSGGGASAESPLALTTNSYTVTIGAGGAGGTYGSTNGTSGGTSSIAGTGLTTKSTTGGGGGTYNSAQTSKNGGSGGGAGGDGGTTGGLGTANEGYNGGTTTAVSGGGWGGAGGGGAGGLGGDPNYSTGKGGNGGNTLGNSITGTTVYYSGGGRGGRAYYGSSPDVGSNPANWSQNANSGMGGQASISTTTDSAGRSGIVIIRYAV